MTISPVTVFEGALPSMTDPVTFDPRMAALMEFIVDVFGPEFAASIGQINAAFAGADDVTTALSALTVLRGYGATAAPLRGRDAADTISNDGFARANAGTAGNPTADEAYLFFRHKGAGDAVGAILAIGQTSRNFYIAVRNAGAWGDWLQMPRIGTAQGNVPALGVGGLLSTAVIPERPMGYGQSTQDVSGSRSAGTWYQNSTGRPIFVNMVIPPETGRLVQVNGAASATGAKTVGRSTTAAQTNCSFMLPPGEFYRIEAGANLTTWTEVR